MRHLEHTNSMSQPVRRKKRDHLPWLIFAAVATVATSRIVFGVPEIVGAAMREETQHDLGEPSTAQGPNPYAEGDRILTRGAAHVPAEPSGSAVASQNPWKPTKATFYGMPYDDGKRRLCADGKTVYTSGGMFCATRLLPLGSIIEVRRGNVTLRLRVADTQAKRYGHLIDLPSKTWDRFGAKRSAGVLAVEWRRAK